jgi:hypothetical protein
MVNRQFLYKNCCENDKEHSELVGHHLLGCLLDAVYDPFILIPCQWVCLQNALMMSNCQSVMISC